MSTNGMPIFDEFNNFLGYRGSNSDITERKEADDIRTRFGRLLESSLNEIYFFDAQTLRFVDVNHGARENIGYSLDELRTMTPLDITTEYSKESFECLLSPLRSGEKDIQVAFTDHKRKDGSLYPIEAHIQFAEMRFCRSLLLSFLISPNASRLKRRSVWQTGNSTYSQASPDMTSTTS